MDQILVGTKNRKNATLIEELLKDRYNVVFYENSEAIDDRFDLVVMDGCTLHDFLNRQTENKIRSETLFRPVLLVTSKKDVTLLTAELWKTADDIISTPIQKNEFMARVEVLLRARRQSLKIGHLNEALMGENERLERESKTMVDFFSNMSHELRTPLSIILAGVDYLLKFCPPEAGDSDKYHKTLFAVKQNGLRLMRLVNNLLDLTKIDSGYMKLYLQNVNLNCCISEIVDSVQEYAREKQIFLTFISDSGIPETAVDEDKLERIMLNLLSNAVKHTRQNGQIVVRLREDKKGGRIVISVKDNGCGIPVEKQEMIFERFKQVDTSFSRQTEGCGIGLSLAKSLVELHQGRMWVKSAPGKGSEFFFSLPVRKADSVIPIQKNDSNMLNHIYMEFSHFRINV